MTILRRVKILLLIDNDELSDAKLLYDFLDYKLRYIVVENNYYNTATLFMNNGQYILYYDLLSKHLIFSNSLLEYAMLISNQNTLKVDMVEAISILINFFIKKYKLDVYFPNDYKSFGKLIIHEPFV